MNARDVPSLQVGHGQALSIGLKSLACLVSPGTQISVTVFAKEVHVGLLRFNGPVCVRATPNRAVLVGNTQSALRKS